MSRSKPLIDLTRHEHETLKKMGFLWELYPEASGDYAIDTGQLRNSGVPFQRQPRLFSPRSFVRPPKAQRPAQQSACNV